MTAEDRLKELQIHIQKLQDLALVHEIATEYDGVPNNGELEDFNVMGYLTDDLGLKLEEEKVNQVLSQYEGESLEDVEAEIFRIIMSL